ncbi:MAG: DNA primase, partial [Acidobacteriota bacterium]
MRPDSRAALKSVPEELKCLSQWVVWRSETRQGKKTKLPYCSRTGRPAKANDPATWSSFDEACRALAGNDGVGFVFSEEDPYLGIDLDNVIDENGALCDWASRLLERFGSGAYVEVSPSGRGLHLIVKAQKPGDRCRRKLGRGAIEIYDRSRYFTVTG